MFTKFWRFHYFDWLTFMRRGGVYAWGGGLVTGTILFGSPDISLKRCIAFYRTWAASEKPNTRGDGAGFLVDGI